MPTPTSVRLEEWQRRALQDHGSKLDRSESWIIKLAVTRLLREEGYSPLDEQPTLPIAAPAPVVPVAEHTVLEPVESRGSVMVEERPAPVQRSQHKAPAKKKTGPSGGWTPERKWKAENLRRRTHGLKLLSFEEWQAANPQ